MLLESSKNGSTFGIYQFWNFQCNPEVFILQHIRTNSIRQSQHLTDVRRFQKLHLRHLSARHRCHEAESQWPEIHFLFSHHLQFGGRMLYSFHPRPSSCPHLQRRILKSRNKNTDPFLSTTSAAMVFSDTSLPKKPQFLTRIKAELEPVSWYPSLLPIPSCWRGSYYNNPFSLRRG